MKREDVSDSLTAVMEDHWLGGLNSKHLFLTVLESWKSRVEDPADSVSSESSLVGCRPPDLSLYPHVAERGQESSLGFFSEEHQSQS